MSALHEDKGCPLVSVIIPTYNNAHVLPRAIRSVLAQTYSNWELIVVDDGSSDNTAEVMGQFEDPRIRYIRHDNPGMGPGAARNTGLRLAQGDYVAFLDSDDEWLPEKLEAQLGVFKRASERVGVVYCGVLRVYDGTGFRRTHIPRVRGMALQDALALEVGCTPSTTMVRRAYLSQVGLFDESLMTGEDLDMWLRLARVCYFDFTEHVLVIKHEMDKESSRSRVQRVVADRERLWRKHGLLSLGRTLTGRQYALLGHTLIFEGSRTGALYLLKAIMAVPWKAWLWGFLMLSIVSPALYRRTVLRLKQLLNA
ncbi:glycosyltransferase family 2 protein [Geochorda subterranea]|uniref:Glycosyltransferase family 2 protein n=1 Tax=Geochorda subterranea TaxID=3109564 RepID=A0ABZ1BMC1_9FIRM|nr:glycosyltransferase family 2 protein [Limnochorda sp. LNt]WRP13728.1 glycosyltransferase family 2 protein [Limnochorda sp. LNt]